jgi:hypothetical protein
MTMPYRLALACAAAFASTSVAQPTEPASPAPSEAAQSTTVAGTPAANAEAAAAADASPSIAAPPPADDAWRADLTAWIWIVSMDGTVGARGQQSDVSASFGDMLEASDSIFAFSGRLEVGKGEWAGYIDAMYSKLGVDDQSGPLGLADIDIDFETTMIDFGVMYRLGNWEPTGEAAKNAHNITLDLYGGGRFTSLDLDVDPAALPNQSQMVNWIDPIIGAKLVLPLAESWQLSVNGDIGGFGAASDFTWSATGLLGYDFQLGSMQSTAFLGYRAIGQDYSEGSGANEFTWDVVQHGPIIGLSMRF